MRSSPKLLALVLFTALSTGESQSSIYFNGAYGSLSLGGAYLSSNPKVNTTSGQNSASIAKMTPAAGAALGLMTELGVSTWVAGLELFVHKTFANFKRGVGSGATGQSIQVKRQLGYGPAIMAGKLLNPKSMLYLKAGLEFSKYSNHPVIGGGLRYAYSDRLHLGLEYGVAVIGKKEIQKASTGVSNNSAIQAKMTEHRIMIKICYQFTSPLASRDIPPQEPHVPNK